VYNTLILEYCTPVYSSTPGVLEYSSIYSYVLGVLVLQHLYCLTLLTLFVMVLVMAAML
jgi:hypothetical protein